MKEAEEGRDLGLDLGAGSFLHRVCGFYKWFLIPRPQFPHLWNWDPSWDLIRLCVHTMYRVRAPNTSVLLWILISSISHSIRLSSYSLLSVLWHFFHLLLPALLLNFFIGAIIFNFQKLFYTLPLFFFFSTACSVFLWLQYLLSSLWGYEFNLSVFSSLPWTDYFLWGELFCVYPGPLSPVTFFSPKVCFGRPVLAVCQ